MPRQARKFSESGYLHIVQRGIGKQLLFETPADYNYYLEILEKVSLETGVTVCVYCLMENHTHLLLYDKKEKIPEFMQKIGIRYSYYFNKKYERVGHLFQDRYHSEPVENEAQLIVVTRLAERNDDICLDCDMGRRHDDKWALQVIHDQLDGRSGTALQAMDRKERDRVLHNLKAAGLSIRQLERLTGINRGVIQKA